MIVVVWILIGITSALAMMAASRFAPRHAVSLAEKLQLPPFLVGMTLVALGTDVPEIVNSIMSSYLGHGDINVGDSVGSVFTQASLALGLFPFVARSALPVERRQALLIPALTIVNLVIVAFLVKDGYISRADAALLVLAWSLSTGLLWRWGVATPEEAPRGTSSRAAGLHAVLALLALAAVGGAASVFVFAVASISASLGVPEYILSFFGASVGTSLPELVVEVTALRRGQRDIAMGDVLGSCLVDASLSVGAGPLLFPIAVTAGLAIRGVIVASTTMLLVGGLLGWRRKHDRVTGAILLGAYVVAYFFFLSRS